MADKKRKLLASAAVTAGLLGGGVVGMVLGVPGVSGAQATTTLPQSPATTAPASPGTDHAEQPHAPGTGTNCRGRGGTAPGGTTPPAPSAQGTATNVRAGAAGRV